MNERPKRSLISCDDQDRSIVMSFKSWVKESYNVGVEQRAAGEATLLDNVLEHYVTEPVERKVAKVTVPVVMKVKTAHHKVSNVWNAATGLWEMVNVDKAR
jgi:hypothetical protein